MQLVLIIPFLLTFTRSLMHPFRCYKDYYKPFPTSGRFLHWRVVCETHVCLAPISSNFIIATDATLMWVERARPVLMLNEYWTSSGHLREPLFCYMKLDVFLYMVEWVRWFISWFRNNIIFLLEECFIGRRRIRPLLTKSSFTVIFAEDYSLASLTTSPFSS